MKNVDMCWFKKKVKTDGKNKWNKKKKIQRKTKKTDANSEKTIRKPQSKKSRAATKLGRPSSATPEARRNYNSERVRNGPGDVRTPPH